VLGYTGVVDSREGANRRSLSSGIGAVAACAGFLVVAARRSDFGEAAGGLGAALECCSDVLV